METEQIGRILAGLDFRAENMLQHESEVIAMLETILERSEIRSAIEIGTFEGATAYLWGQVVKPHGGKVYCIDEQFGTDYKAAPEWSNRCKPVYRGTEIEENIIEIEGMSQDHDVIDRLAGMLRRKKVDFLFIDGDHYYVPAKADFVNYSRFVREEGWIAFHDIMNETWPVSQLWKELKTKYESWEFVIQRQPPKSKKSHRDLGFINGIGLIRWKENA